MNTPTVALILAALLSAGPAPKKTPKVKAPPQTMLIIWGGGPLPADADAAEAHFAKAGFSSSLPLSKMFSSDVKGLKPGFHIAVLGACPGNQALSLLRRSRRFYGGVYLRRIPKEGAIARLQCPTLTTPKRPLFHEPEPDSQVETIKGEEEVTAGDLTLVVTVRGEVENNGETMSSSWTAEATLSKGKTAVDTQTLSAPNFANIESLHGEGDSIVLETMDLSEDCGTGSYYDGATYRRTFRIKAGKIKVTQKKLGAQFGLCSPSAEGLDACSYGCRMARFEAVQQACDNTSRSTCDAALREYDSTAPDCDCSDHEPSGD